MRSRMSDGDAKARKKEAKARAKAAKAESKGRVRAAEALADAVTAAATDRRLPGGVGVSVRRGEDGSELVVSGLSDGQLERLLPEVNKELVIAAAAERSAFRAGLLRFVREGLFQTVVKIIAGLVAGYVLIRFGLR
jgi:hypothetical protein